MAVRLTPEQREQKQQQDRCEEIVAALEALADSREQMPRL